MLQLLSKLFCGSFFIIVIFQQVYSQDDDPIVKTQQGLVKGIRFTTSRDKEIIAFLGIPYAKPPLAELRFKLPETSKELKAVMVWIHGGGFVFGSGTAYLYGPDHLLTEDVVVVSINYRLGLFGFFSLCEAGVSGNAAMKDQVMALRWVQQNIAQFGGDPDKVTIFGESAGGASVHLLLLSPMSKGLFHRAIAQSGNALVPWSYAEPEFLRNEIFKTGELLKCDNTSPQELFNCLQKAPASDIARVHINKVLNASTAMIYRPTKECTTSNEEIFLQEKPEKIISAGKFHDVPFIIGVDSRELMITEKLEELLSETEKEYDNLILIISYSLIMRYPTRASEIAKKAWNYYIGDQKSSERKPYEELSDLLSDLFFVAGTDKTIKTQVERSTSPIYNYVFSYDGSLGLFKSYLRANMSGVPHTTEIGYIFHISLGDPAEEDSDEMKTISRMVKMWTNFAKTGDPTSEMDNLLRVKWNPVTKTDHVYLDIDKELSMKRDYRKEQMEFWEPLLIPE